MEYRHGMALAGMLIIACAQGCSERASNPPSTLPGNDVQKAEPAKAEPAAPPAAQVSITSEKHGSDAMITFTCRGTIADEVLTELQISSEALAKGVMCVVGDFDGNGSSDYLLAGHIVEREGSDSYPAVLSAVLCQGDQILKHIAITDGHLFVPALYPATDTKGENGEPTSKTDGFVEWGEGGTSYIYLYDSASGTFKITGVASESA